MTYLRHHVVPDTIVWYYSFTNRTYPKETVPSSNQRVGEFGTREAVDHVCEQILQTSKCDYEPVQPIRIRSAIN